ncbi:Crp/Fnr family transcriptional regulator [Leptolyngbya sp. NIES-2104]|uniref:Crp/Fnr family transcriptional regulator n=1 Tax=Leptolyngbya sp. NIES-2104 TaxID=1552121 RepID=UPI0006EC70F1|nr:Crp/Fnr family transcriptional regulator [Leptolyngbya sp. NIES-2104]GAP94500.1 cAMP-binding protein - catabolite gene activator and regulatory subunit of cAMP-dependent protein kinase [Leptolyngbya sp. NIES-2104]
MTRDFTDSVAPRSHQATSLRWLLHAMSPPTNQLLAALSSGDYERLTSFLETVTLSSGQVLYEPNQSIDSAYFPTTAVIAHLNLMESGREVETALIGNEGMIGVPLVLGTDRIPMRAIVQIPGTAFRISAKALLSELNANRSLQSLLLRYVQTLMGQIAQNLTCMQLHSTQERCCYLLLLLQDRIGTPDLILTQELLARMVGVRRDRISEIIAILERAGLIDHQRGRVTILDRCGLESAACDCYRILRAAFAVPEATQFDQPFDESR